MQSADAGRLTLRGARRSRPGAVIATMRPKQWIKNALVIAAAGAAGALGHDDTPGRVIVACASFCLLASGIYAINDVRDAQEDRRHPRKRFRPVAAGDLDPRFATGLGVSLVLAGLFLCAAIGALFVLVGVGYAALTLSYTLVWRHLIVFDIFAVAGGFVLRAVAGGVAAPVTLSRWFLLVVTSSAVFVAAAKRYAELRRTDGPSDGEDGCSTPTAPDARADHRGGDCRGAARVLHVGVLAARGSGDPVAAVDDPAIRPLPAPLRRARASGRGRGSRGPAAVRPTFTARGAGVAGAVRPGGQCGWLTRSRSPAASCRARVITGWGRSRVRGSRLSVPGASGSSASRCGRRATGTLAQGMGRSYGDAAQISGGLVIETTRLKRIEFDAERGTVTAQAGVTIGELLRELVPAGWMVPVVPGTQHVTSAGRSPAISTARTTASRGRWDAPRGDLAATGGWRARRAPVRYGRRAVRSDARGDGPDGHHHGRAGQTQPDPGRDAIGRHRPGRSLDDALAALGAGGGNTGSRGSTCCRRRRDEAW